MFLVRTDKTLFFVPSLGAESRKARRPSKDGRASGHREAARSPAGERPCTAEHLEGESAKQGAQVMRSRPVNSLRYRSTR